MLGSLSDRRLPPTIVTPHSPRPGALCGAEEKGEPIMAYIYCDTCGIGFHSNVHSCPECRKAITPGHDVGLVAHGRRRHAHAGVAPLREDVENEVRESIYGWRSGTVELCEQSKKKAPAERVGEPLQ